MNSDSAVNFFAARKGYYASGINKGDGSAQDDNGHSSKENYWTHKVDLSSISDATVRDKAWAMLGRYSTMWSGGLGGYPRLKMDYTQTGRALCTLHFVHASSRDAFRDSKASSGATPGWGD